MLARLNHSAARQHLHDAVAKGDPTGTLDIRRKYRAALEMRWRKLGAQLRMVLVTQDMLGLGGKTTVLSLSMTSLAPDGVLRSFQNWLDTTLKNVVLQNEATYLDPMIEGTFKRALVRAMRLTKNKAMPADARETIGTLQQLTLMELQGIVEALSQRIVRLASWAQLDNVKPPMLMRQVLLAIEQIGVTRGRALIESVVVKAHSTATLDQFEVAGVKNVGLLPEIVRANPKARKRLGDAVEPAKRRGTREQVPSKRTVQRIAGEEKKVEQAFGTEQVEIETAGDDKVCPECEELAADGPYTIDEARGLIPAHPWCRCAFVPEGSDLFGNLLEFGDEWSEEDHPRDPGGEGGGQFTSGGGGLSLEEKPRDTFHSPYGEGEKMRNDIAKAAPEYSKVERNAIKDYTAHDYTKTPVYAKINGELRSGRMPTGKLGNITSGLDSAMARSKLPQDVMLYRGMNVDAGKLSVGSEFIDKGFSSTTTEWNTASDFQGTKVLMRVHAKQGSNALAITPKLQGTGKGDEREVILPRGSRFKVTSVTEEKLPNRDYSRKIHNVVML